MEQEINEVSGKNVYLIFPVNKLGFSFTIYGYLIPGYGNPAGYKVVFQGGMSEFWFKADCVKSVNKHLKTIVLKVPTE